MYSAVHSFELWSARQSCTIVVQEMPGGVGGGWERGSRMKKKKKKKRKE